GTRDDRTSKNVDKVFENYAHSFDRVERFDQRADNVAVQCAHHHVHLSRWSGVRAEEEGFRVDHFKALKTIFKESNIARYQSDEMALFQLLRNCTERQCLQVTATFRLDVLLDLRRS